MTAIVVHTVDGKGADGIFIDNCGITMVIMSVMISVMIMSVIISRRIIMMVPMTMNEWWRRWQWWSRRQRRPRRNRRWW